MSGTSPTQSAFRFGAYEVDPRSGELRKLGVRIRLQEQPLRILLHLVENAGEVVTREELRQRLWPRDTFVDFDNGLNAAIRRLRGALCDSAEQPRYVETLPRRGYRFIFPVERVAANPTPATVEAPAGPQVTPDQLAASLAPAHLEVRRGGASSRRLHWVAAVICLIAIAGATVALLHWRHSMAPVRQGRLSIAVLPFVNLTGNASEEYFSDGMTEEMIAQLGGMDPERLAVVARTSAMHYKNSNKSVADIARELGVNYVLEGSVRLSGRRVRVTAQLIQTSDQSHLWARDYDRDLRDVLSLEGEVSRAIAAEIQLKLEPGHEHQLQQRSVDPDAHDAYLRARYHWNQRTEPDLLRAIQLFQEAIRKDPGYAPAYAGLADCYIMLGNWQFLPPSDAYPKATSNAARALSLDPELADAEASLAFAIFLYDWDWPRAEEGFRRAIQLNPNYAPAHHYYSVYLISAGRKQEAIEQIDIAEKLDPLSLIIRAVHAWIYYLAGDYDAAVYQSATVLDMDKSYAPAHLYIAEAQLQKHEYAAAISHLRQAIASGNTSAELLAHVGEAYALRVTVLRQSGPLSKCERLRSAGTCRRSTLPWYMPR